ncbi:MAG: manganese efflux pump MntP family protein, partial [Campylobacterales bacterium]|nr:manganese efflux pump MntP family protein [Campylobacterales bacterium]
GGNMIVAGFKDDVEESIKTISNKLLITLAFATSIDALAAGVTLVNFSINVYISVIVIGIVTFFFSLLGFQIGKKKGSQYESKGEILGGVILLLIGLKIYLF